MDAVSWISERDTPGQSFIESTHLNRLPSQSNQIQSAKGRLHGRGPMRQRMGREPVEYLQQIGMHDLISSTSIYCLKWSWSTLEVRMRQESHPTPTITKLAPYDYVITEYPIWFDIKCASRVLWNGIIEGIEKAWIRSELRCIQKKTTYEFMLAIPGICALIKVLLVNFTFVSRLFRANGLISIPLRHSSVPLRVCFGFTSGNALILTESSYWHHNLES